MLIRAGFDSRYGLAFNNHKENTMQCRYKPANKSEFTDGWIRGTGEYVRFTPKESTPGNIEFILTRPSYNILIDRMLISGFESKGGEHYLFQSVEVQALDKSV